MNKLYLFKDQDDYVKELTKDKVINIIGTKGSGKTTTSLKYIEEDDYIVVNLDKLFDAPGANDGDKELPKIRDMLIKKYGYLQDGYDFINYYNDIVSFVKKLNKTLLIEGNSIEDLDPKDLKGTIIIKRTGVFKSFKRAVKRDYKTKYFMDLEKEKHKYFYKLTRLYKITKRRKKIFKQSKNIERIIDKLETL